ncbi:citrate synthase [Coprinellus micaceus]|uniref:Citrate synthase n=1 Tax=Coprinellus micaceus TaxID=71717 RepID=A0A4Y7TAV0_COPMI|nr:citrate synthase [Coprinellus micaceus]
MLSRIARSRTAAFRFASTQRRLASTKSLRETLQEVIPGRSRSSSRSSQTVVGDVKVENIIGGMRGLKAMLWEASVLDPIEGIRFHGLSIPDCQKVLPAAPGGKEIIPESMLWLLLTGQVPSTEQTRALSQELAEKGELPKGIKKAEYWTYTLEDCINLMARLPALAARIYRNVYKPGQDIPAIRKDLDLIGNYSNMLGYGGNESLTEYLRLYIALHGDHEGDLVGSTLSDPYLAYSAALFASRRALTLPPHSLANQEVLRWQMAMQKELGHLTSTHEDIRAYLWKTLKSGQVVPGYGHGVLRNPDPRFIALQEFCQAKPELKQSPIVDLVNKTFEVAPDVLKEHGKTKNPWPNVDATSGCVLYHYGLTEFKYYTVIFGVSRALGCLTQLVWARALGLPLERPKSVSMDVLEKLVKQ